MNAEMFVLLGVSKPILNYVIFCLQEVSNWTLEEGKRRKNSLTKYSTLPGIDPVRPVLKKEMAEIRADSNNMKLYREVRDTETGVDTLTNDTNPMAAKHREVLEEEEGYTHLQSRVTELEYAWRVLSDLQISRVVV